uniref:Uncharacterized protein n=1 Tax=Amphimedon queenslandica TaxID=400682 RepID=A0A1X7VC98_AMPQE
MSSLRSIHLMQKKCQGEREERRQRRKGKETKRTETKRREETVQKRMFYLQTLGEKKEGRPLDLEQFRPALKRQLELIEEGGREEK